MSISIRIIRYVPLTLIVAAVAAPGARAASGSQSSEAPFKAAHWKHEDSVYAASRGASVRSLPAWLDAHWKHEDAQYDARTVSPTRLQSPTAAVESDEGIDSLAVLTATGGAAALLVLGTAAVAGVRRKHRVAES
jgi:hypothetical protein